MNTEKTTTEDYRALALKASLTLPHDGLQGLLTDADRIEKWLNAPTERSRLLRNQLVEMAYAKALTPGESTGG